MNGRYFSGRRLECFYYDGKTNYDRKVSLEEEEKRIGWEFFEFLFYLLLNFQLSIMVFLFLRFRRGVWEMAGGERVRKK